MFDAEFKIGVALPMEVVEEEYTLSFEEAGLDRGAYVIPSVIKELCSLHNGFSLRWRCLREIAKSFSVMGFTNYVDGYRFVQQSIVHEGKRLFLFDDFLDMWKVYVELTADESRHKLCYFDLYEKRIYTMRIAVDAYVEKAAQSRGLTNWHEFFFDDRSYESDEGNRTRFKNEMTAVFSDVPFDEFIHA